MDQYYTVDHESRVQNAPALMAGQVYKQTFYYTPEDINKLASMVGDKQAHQPHKPIRYGYLESSVLNKALPPVLLQREAICIRKNINFHKLMYVNTHYVSLVNIREVQEENELVLVHIAILENDSEKLLASGEVLLLAGDKSASDKLSLKKGLRLGSH
jgi:hypothetical protein